MKLIKRGILAIMLISSVASAKQRIKKESKFIITLQELIDSQCKHDISLVPYKVCRIELEECIKRRVYRYGTSITPSGKHILMANRMCILDY